MTQRLWKRLRRHCYPLLHRIWREERGANMVIVALALMMLFGFGAVAIDGGNAFYQQQRMQIAADAVQSRPHRANWDAEDLGAHLVRGAFPRDKQQQVAVFWCQVTDGRHHTLGLGRRIQSFGNVEERVARHRRSIGDPTRRPKSALLGTPVTSDQVGGDSEQPRPFAPASRVVPVRLTERDLEHVANYVGRRVTSEPSRDVAVHGIDVLVEQSGPVVVHALLLPAHPNEFIRHAHYGPRLRSTSAYCSPDPAVTPDQIGTSDRPTEVAGPTRQ